MFNWTSIKAPPPQIQPKYFILLKRNHRPPLPSINYGFQLSGQEQWQNLRYRHPAADSLICNSPPWSNFSTILFRRAVHYPIGAGELATPTARGCCNIRSRGIIRSQGDKQAFCGYRPHCQVRFQQSLNGSSRYAPLGESGLLAG